MAIILNIETSTKNCAVSIAENGLVLASKALNNGNYSHAEVLHVFIEEVLNMANISKAKIDAVAVSKGPGSYTGLRIGVSAAKGLCFALDVPLIAVDTLKSLASTIKLKSGLVAPMLDARRMEVYTAVYNHKNEQIRAIQADVIDENSFKEYLENGLVYFLGDGAAKCKDVITDKNAIFVEDKHPSAVQMAPLSYYKYKKNDMEDVAYFEPFYLKDFIVIPEKKKKPTF
ncbi:tRNA (adenosine(37)-N6)-threonylcarbamoyltransferase complex dimerization subunit type 1 TsaB [uncultured Polaribacter sp.]|uniref:tRNA (adenosine(37)-N6)-threonylcarbamoyltransferase complex dimerization subunit type 1 TsaB n=1 Tax=uncultured Polaribacter sp. TaxID=174711 RepID=UPI0026090E11|nr:tRNA (adenosine(37)-N6)-threonylcarbamoyltransferase complex dimerization subunit type 1 TsaB [uncultured Polaribacter sp.]